ncbi:MAG: hypothetical protein K0R07_1612 [Sedimentibacter sp.]|nr:hypothetical protein [Sedimentibacter sp.]
MVHAIIESKGGLIMFGIYIAVIYFVIFIIVSQALTPSEYNWKINTVSELAAQGYKNKKVMQAGFIGFGIILPILLFYNMYFRGASIIRVAPIAIYGLSVGASGIFCTSSFVDNVEHSAAESRIHSLLAQVAGFSFVGGITICMIVEKVMWIKVLHAVTVVFVMFCSIMFAKAPQHRGIYQRIMYLGSFLWLIFLF